MFPRLCGSAHPHPLSPFSHEPCTLGLVSTLPRSLWLTSPCLTLSPRRWGVGDRNGISRQTMSPSTDASKQNTCEATFFCFDALPMLFMQHECYWGSKGTVKNFWV